MLSPKTPSPPPLNSPACRSISHPYPNAKNPRRRHATKKKAPLKAAKAPAAPAKPRTVAPKEKPTTMSQEVRDEEKLHCTMVMADRRRHHIAAEAYKPKPRKRRLPLTCASAWASVCPKGASNTPAAT